eukprot:scaffold262490_cov30-Tisochrysis_lutea.AAC.1
MGLLTVPVAPADRFVLRCARPDLCLHVFVALLFIEHDLRGPARNVLCQSFGGSHLVLPLIVGRLIELCASPVAQRRRRGRKEFGGEPIAPRPSEGGGVRTAVGEGEEAGRRGDVKENGVKPRVLPKNKELP